MKHSASTGNLLYYHPKSDPSQEELREKIEALCLAYPKYGYRRIRELLLRQGHTVSHRRVARFMKEGSLSVSIKRVCRTTRSLEAAHPWGNRIQNLDICRCDQVWVGDITYVRLKRRFIYVALLMDVFTRMIRGWQVSLHLTQALTLKPLQAALHQGVLEIHHSDQGVQYLSNAYLSALKEHSIEISIAHRGRPWKTAMPKGSSEPSRREKFISMTMTTLPKPEPVSGILSDRCITRNATLGVRVFNTYGISAKKLVLTLRNFGPNKWWHYICWIESISTVTRR